MLSPSSILLAAAVMILPAALRAQQTITAQAAFADWNQQHPGVHRKITLADLPQPDPEQYARGHRVDQPPGGPVDGDFCIGNDGPRLIGNDAGQPAAAPMVQASSSASANSTAGTAPTYFSRPEATPPASLNWLNSDDRQRALRRPPSRRWRRPSRT